METSLYVPLTEECVLSQHVVVVVVVFVQAVEKLGSVLVVITQQSISPVQAHCTWGSHRRTVGTGSGTQTPETL